MTECSDPKRCSHCCIHCLQSSMEMLSKAASESCWTSATSAERLPFKPASSMGTKKITRSGVGWVEGVGHKHHFVSSQTLQDAEGCVGGALSWCKNQSALCHFSGHFHRRLSRSLFNTFKQTCENSLVNFFNIFVSSARGRAATMHLVFNRHFTSFETIEPPVYTVHPYTCTLVFYPWLYP